MGRYLLGLSLMVLVCCQVNPCQAVIPIPARIGGTVSEGGVLLTQATAGGYTFEVRDSNGNSFTPAAVDADGLNASGWYIIDIPLYDANDQPGGAKPGSTGTVHVFTNGVERTLLTPANGIITIGDSASLTQVDLDVILNKPPTADAGMDQTVAEGSLVNLDGTASTDPDDGIASYMWTQSSGPSVVLSDPSVSQPSFIAPDVGIAGDSLTFTLTVMDKGGNKATADTTVNVTWVNAPPSVDAGANQTVNAAQVVSLNGANSFDPDDGIASYAWSQVAGPNVTLSDATAVSPTFTAPAVGAGGTALTFKLTITDQGGLQATDTVIINVASQNIAPTADAGVDQAVNDGVLVTLDGSNSSDQDDGIASYAWVQTGGPTVVLSNAAAVKPTFTSPNPGVFGAALIFELTVTDNGGLQGTDTCIVNVAAKNQAPSADAGPDQNVNDGVLVTLDGSNSSDPDDGIATYLWTQTAGPGATLSDPTAAKPTFTAAIVGAGVSLTFELTVTDKVGLKSNDTCIVNIVGQNAVPVADAGADQNVASGVPVTLDGSASTDSDDGIASYIWKQLSGPAVTLSNAASVSPTFFAPVVTSAGVALKFQLTVTDVGGAQATDSTIVNISWANNAPTADAGTDTVVKEGSTVTLNASKSADSDGSIVKYHWAQTSGPTVTLSAPNWKTSTFVPPPVGKGGATLVFELTVTDDDGLQSTDTVKCTVTDNGITTFPADVVSFLSTTNLEMGIKASAGALVALSTVDPKSIAATSGRPGRLPYGLIGATCKVSKKGDTAKIIVYLSDAAPADGKWYKYSKTLGWIDFSRNKISKGTGDGAVFSKDRTSVTIYITDNGPYDENPNNGIIKDPSGLGTPAAGAPPSDDSGGGGCFIETAAFGTDSSPRTPYSWWLALIAICAGGWAISSRVQRYTGVDDKGHN